MKVGIVAAEPSGDFLGAQLIEDLRAQRPGLKVTGIGGPALRAAGCDVLYPMEKLAVMGLVEVLGKLWELSRLRARLADYFSSDPPDVFIGVDAPDFNLGLERTLHEKGIKTVHYVCPTAWAWRPWRTHGIKRAAQRLLSLFPFEEAFFRNRGVSVHYVGHPLARQVALEADAIGARRRLGLAANVLTVALLPGSRADELNRLVRPFIDAAAWLAARHEQICFISNAINAEAEQQLRTTARRRGIQLLVVRDRSADTLAAADVALVASGTVTLEAMLHKTPLVVAYRMHSLSYWLLRALLRVKFVALPNLLAQARLVPEYFQSDCRAEVLGPALQYWLEHPQQTQSLMRRFTELHHLLCNADAGAAQVVLDLIDDVDGRR